MLYWDWKNGVKVYHHESFGIFWREKHEKYKLTFNFSYDSIINIFNQKKKNMNDYLTEEERKYNFINDVSLFPFDFRWGGDVLYYNEFHIDKSFQSIDGLKLLFGGPMLYQGDLYNLNDDDHKDFFKFTLENSRIHPYYPKNKTIDKGSVLATIKWI